MSYSEGWVRHIEETEVGSTQKDDGTTRLFDTGATRDTAEGKPDYEGYLSPLVIERFGQYMMKNQLQSDGSLRASDNWQKGIPKDVYMKSGWRHFMDWWRLHRSKSYLVEAMEETLSALMFNVMGYLHEHITRTRAAQGKMVDEWVKADPGKKGYVEPLDTED